MKNVLAVYKPVGKTPLQVIEQLRFIKPEYKAARLGYAGRLDPMAEGLLLILVNDENLQRKTYERLNKIYEFTLLLGITTDTYDRMGRITKIAFNALPKTELVVRKINAISPRFVGSLKQPYPPYSSIRVQGKPLFWWARENKLQEITIPIKEIQVNDLQFVTIEKMLLSDVVNETITTINNVTGEFRQSQIKSEWQTIEATYPDQTVFVVSMKIDCSSGTYVRSIVQEIGELLGYGAIATQINRIRVGEYTIDKALHIF